MGMIRDSSKIAFFVFLLFFAISGLFLGGLESVFNLATSPLSFPKESNISAVCIFAVIQASLFFLFSVISGMIVFPDPLSFVSSFFEKIEKNHRYLFALILMEEIYCRWFFLEVLPNVFSPSAWWPLLIVANLSWIAFYWAKFNRSFSPVLMLPNLVCGFLYSYIFVKFGFWPALFTHFFSASLVMILDKVEDIKEDDKWVVVYSLCPMIGAMLILYFNPSYEFDLLSLIVKPQVGISKLDWFLYSILAIFGLKILSTLLMFDTGSIRPDGKSDNYEQFQDIRLGVGICLVLSLIVFVAGIAIIDFFTQNIAALSVVLTLAFCFVMPSQSGSASAKNFLFTLPKMFLLVVGYEHFGMMILVLFLLTIFILHVPIFEIDRRGN